MLCIQYTFLDRYRGYCFSLCYLPVLYVIGHEKGNKSSKRAIEKFIETMGGQYDDILRNWTPIGDEIADHHRYTVTQKQYNNRNA
jgi:hypothetical protein